MTPAITPLVSAMLRAAALIERGAKPASALRQVAEELTEHDRVKSAQGGRVFIESEPFALGNDPAPVKPI